LINDFEKGFKNGRCINLGKRSVKKTPVQFVEYLPASYGFLGCSYGYVQGIKIFFSL